MVQVSSAVAADYLVEKAFVSNDVWGVSYGANRWLIVLAVLHIFTRVSTRQKASHKAATAR